MSNPTLDGIRECPKKNQQEQPNHMTAILKKLFPDVEWRHDKSIIDTEGKVVSKKRPDFFSVEKKLIIEIDGDGATGVKGHFSSSEKIVNDKNKTAICEQLGYKVIRIPFYVQLDAEMIAFYFGIDYKESLYPASKEHGFAHKDALLPANFCYLGIKRFENDLETLPKRVVDKIISTLKGRVERYESMGYTHEESIDMVLPSSLFHIIK